MTFILQIIQRKLGLFHTRTGVILESLKISISFESKLSLIGEYKSDLIK